MNWSNTGRQVFVLAVCLTASACRTCREEMDSHVPVSTGKPALSARGTTSDVLRKMKEIVLPEVTFRSPATIIDAVSFFKQASRDYDRSETSPERRGVDFTLRLPGVSAGDAGATPDPFACETNAVPEICALSARSISLYDAVKLVCDVTGMKMVVRGGAVLIVPDYGGEEGELVTRSFDLPAPLCGVCGKVHDGHASQSACVVPARNSDWKAWLESMGVTWPEGSSVTSLSSIGKLRVTNLMKNLSLIAELLSGLTAMPQQVSVEVDVVAFRLRDVEKLARDGGVPQDKLTALWKRGKAKPVSTARVMTKSGQEAIAKTVQEVIYPDEFSGGEAGHSNGVSAVAGRVLLSRFTMREVGMILQVVPNVGADGESIDLMLSSQWMTLKRWETYPAAVTGRWRVSAVPFRQPVFEVTSFQTQLTVADGGTVVLGSSSTPDGEWVHVGFLTARRVDVRSGASKNQP